MMAPGELHRGRRASSSSTPGRERRALARRSTPATGRSRSARTSTSPTSTRRCAFDRDGRARLPARRPGGHVGALRARRRRSRSTLVALGGARRVPGLQAATAAERDRPRARYAALYGPTAGDRVRLADTDLWIEVERRPTAPAATRRSSAAARRSASRCCRAATTRAEGAPDLVITNARRARPLGHRQGRRRRSATAASSRSARPATPTSPTASTRRCGSGRRPRSSPARGGSSPPAAIDCHVHFICPQIVDEALAAGMTTLIGGGTGPGRGHERDDRARRRLEPRDDATARSTSCRSTCCCSARATRSRARRSHEQLRAGAGGFKLHEDWGSTPAAIDACLRVARRDAACRSRSTPTRSTRPATSSRRSTAIAGRGDPRLPHRGRRRRPRAGHHRDRGEPERAAVVDEPDAPAHGQHGRRAPRHADGLPPPQPARARGPRVRRDRASARRRSRPRTCSTTSARSR